MPDITGCPRGPAIAGRSMGDLRLIAERWLTPQARDPDEDSEAIKLRFAIERAQWALERWLDSEVRLREAVIARAGIAEPNPGEIETARYFDPLKHPRWPAGTPGSRGGEFAPRGGGGQVELVSHLRSAEARAAAAVFIRARDGSLIVDDRLSHRAMEETVGRGMRDGAEHSFAVDQRTGEVIETRTDSNPHRVEFGEALESSMRDPTREIELHHNHPGGTSFSQTDLDLFAKFPGLRRSVIHGHDGSHYATSLSQSADAADRLRASLDFTRQAVRDAIAGPGGLRGISIDDFNNIQPHIVALTYARAGIIRYDYVLSPRWQRVVNLNRAAIDRITARIADRIR